MNLTDFNENSEPKKQCPWLKCAHGLGVAAYGSCYVAGDPDDPLCSKFVSENSYEERIFDHSYFETQNDEAG
jgi:hypothetical protein